MFLKFYLRKKIGYFQNRKQESFIFESTKIYFRMKNHLSSKDKNADLCEIQNTYPYKNIFITENIFLQKTKHIYFLKKNPLSSKDKKLTFERKKVYLQKNASTKDRSHIFERKFLS